MASKFLEAAFERRSLAEKNIVHFPLVLKSESISLDVYVFSRLFGEAG